MRTSTENILKIADYMRNNREKLEGLFLYQVMGILRTELGVSLAHDTVRKLMESQGIQPAMRKRKLDGHVARSQLRAVEKQLAIVVDAVVALHKRLGEEVPAELVRSNGEQQ